MPAFEEWESFYVIVGAAAGALIGLQFVVMTLIADRPQLATPEAGAAFATPTVVHFGAALLLSALMRVPWNEMHSAAAAWGVAGACGTVYMLLVWRRMIRQNTYRPDWEDWLFHLVVPLIAYAALTLIAFSATSHAEEVLLIVAGLTLLLLFVGVHNSWDAIAYNALVRGRDMDR